MLYLTSPPMKTAMSLNRHAGKSYSPPTWPSPQSSNGYENDIQMFKFTQQYSSSEKRNMWKGAIIKCGAIRAAICKLQCYWLSIVAIWNPTFCNLAIKNNEAMRNSSSLHIHSQCNSTTCWNGLCYMYPCPNQMFLLYLPCKTTYWLNIK